MQKKQPPFTLRAITLILIASPAAGFEIINMRPKGNHTISFEHEGKPRIKLTTNEEFIQVCSGKKDESYRITREALDAYTNKNGIKHPCDPSTLGLFRWTMQRECGIAQTDICTNKGVSITESELRDCAASVGNIVADNVEHDCARSGPAIEL